MTVATLCTLFPIRHVAIGCGLREVELIASVMYYILSRLAMKGGIVTIATLCTCIFFPYQTCGCWMSTQEGERRHIVTVAT